MILWRTPRSTLSEVSYQGPGREANPGRAHGLRRSSTTGDGSPHESFGRIRFNAHSAPFGHRTMAVVMNTLVAVVLGIPGSIAVLGVGVFYGRQAAGLHWGFARLPLALVALILGAFGIVCVIDVAFPTGSGTGVAQPAVAACAAAYLSVGAAALIFGRRYFVWAKPRNGYRQGLWNRFPHWIAFMAMPSLVAITGLVLGLDVMGLDP